MTVQNISNQPNFTGKLFYIDASGKQSKKVERFFSPTIEKEIQELRDMVKNKKYNLYLSHSKKFPLCVEFNANYNYENVKGQKFSKKAITIITDKISMFKQAAESAMENFEKTHLYTKPSIFRKVANLFN